MLDDKLSDTIRKMIEEGPARIAKPLLDVTEQIADDALDLVPVRSGKLKASVQAFSRIFPEEVRAGVRMGNASAPYGYKVKFAAGLTKAERRKMDKGRSIPYARLMAADMATSHKFAGVNVFKAVVRDPALAAVDRLIVELGPAFVGAAGAKP